jgi:hypothetical protein
MKKGLFRWSNGENEMGRACSMYEGKERCMQDFGRET